jgi:hypothetical protein
MAMAGAAPARPFSRTSPGAALGAAAPSVDPAGQDQGAVLEQL